MGTDVVLAPKGAMLPARAVMPLKQELIRHVVGVEKDISKQDVSRIYLHSVGSAAEGVVSHLAGALVYREVRTMSLRAADMRVKPLPLIVEDFGGCSVRNGVVHPDRVVGRWRRRWGRVRG